MSADREGYGDRQAALLRALHTGAGPPAGFAPDDLAAASRSLLDKRARAVAEAWPALSHRLGAEFPARFERYAREAAPPEAGGGLADGLRFARGLDQGALGDDARAELLLARGLMRPDGTPRRGLFLGMVRLTESRRLLIVLRVPLLGRGHMALPLLRG